MKRAMAESCDLLRSLGGARDAVIAAAWYSKDWTLYCRMISSTPVLVTSSRACKELAAGGFGEGQ